MKNLMKIVAMLLFSISVTAQSGLSEVGTFNGSNGEKFPLYLYGVIVQQTPDGKALVPRGANFLTNGMVNSDKQHLSNLLKSTWSEFGGLAQPKNVPCPAGYHVRWVYDKTYKVTTLLFVRDGEIIDGSYSTETEAIQYNSTSAPIPTSIKKLPKVGWATGQVGSFHGSRYETYLGELPNGVSEFRFTGQNVNYPEFDTRKKSTDEMSIIDLPTHSIINFAGTDFVSAIEMKLTDDLGNEVWYLYDTKGGYHPCINRKNCESQLRGNNHPDDASRWVKHGNYQLWVKNHSLDKRAVQRIDFGTTNGGNVSERDLAPGHETSFGFDIGKLESGSYKLNCNVFTANGK